MGERGIIDRAREESEDRGEGVEEAQRVNRMPSATGMVLRNTIAPALSLEKAAR